MLINVGTANRNKHAVQTKEKYQVVLRIFGLHYTRCRTNAKETPENVTSNLQQIFF